jgi:hypothetical protein
VDLKQKRELTAKALLKELGSAELVKDFSNSLRELGICDLKDDESFCKAIADGGEYLSTLLVMYQFGSIPKIIEIKNKIGEQKC